MRHSIGGFARLGGLCPPALLLLVALREPPCSAQPAGEPASPRFDTGSIDRRADPCADFYQYACGGWLANHPIPPDQARWDHYQEMEAVNRIRMTELLNDAAAPRPGRSTDETRLGDTYASCMDAAEIERRGLAPLTSELRRVERITRGPQVFDEIARLHDLDVQALFVFGWEQDLHDANRVIASIDQGGLSLPDRDTYLGEDAAAVSLRGKFRVHVERVFSLLGEPTAAATSDAEAVLRLETALARASLGRVERRDHAAQYHELSPRQLAALAPAQDWRRYFRARGLAEPSEANVDVPEFVTAIDRLLSATPLKDWRAYLRWQLVHATSELLPARFVDAEFDFYGKTLRGLAQMPPRSERCGRVVDRDLGEAAARLYVAHYFRPETKERVLELVALLRRALGAEIRAADWMSEPTRVEALHKLEAITVKIGYPDRWRDDSGAASPSAVVRGDALGNTLRARAVQVRRELAKIGRPMDRGQWFELPQSIDGYHSSQLNEIVFTAAILQPPLYDPDLDDAVNFGAIGGVIGHELTHGFDDQGRKFDGGGNLRDWWTPQDAASYQQRAACFVDQYSGYPAVGDLQVNGKLTLGENVADNGGLRLAYRALQERLAAGRPNRIDGFTAQQRFFLGWAQIRCANVRDETARGWAATDPHSPGRWRVNGVVSNMDAFAQAFQCGAGAAMTRAQPCRIW